jgi:hypothetical protein
VSEAFLVILAKVPFYKRYGFVGIIEVFNHMRVIKSPSTPSIAPLRVETLNPRRSAAMCDALIALPRDA